MPVFLLFFLLLALPFLLPLILIFWGVQLAVYTAEKRKDEGDRLLPEQVKERVQGLTAVWSVALLLGFLGLLIVRYSMT